LYNPKKFIKGFKLIGKKFTNYLFLFVTRHSSYLTLFGIVGTGKKLWKLLNWEETQVKTSTRKGFRG